jgi:hypothetical protein
MQKLALETLLTEPSLSTLHKVTDTQGDRGHSKDPMSSHLILKLGSEPQIPF